MGAIEDVFVGGEEDDKFDELLQEYEKRGNKPKFQNNNIQAAFPPSDDPREYETRE